MKTVITFIAFFVSTHLIYGGPTDHCTLKATQNAIEELEAELLELYTDEQTQEISLDSILIFDQNYDLVDSFEIAFHELDQVHHDLINQSELLIDDGRTIIYQIQE